MLTPPDLAFETIADVLRASYGLRARSATFLPLGADAYAAVFRIAVEDGGSDYFLKLKRGAFNDLEVALPVWLHGHGAAPVMAAQPAMSGALWVTSDDYTWTLYPFFEGHNAFQSALTDAQWVAVGAALRAIHSAHPPLDVAARLRQDDYGPRDRDRVRVWDARVAVETFAEPIAARLAAFWRDQRDSLRQVVDRAEELGALLRRRRPQRVLCHGDFHGANMLFGADGALAIVDWDTASFSPPERDLMFAGSMISGRWDDNSREVALFYQGYNQGREPVIPDPTAEAYYRYERIVTDVADFAIELFGVHGSVENRERSYGHFTGQVLPMHDIALADDVYARIA
ncbi:MAG TPA: aminoglycoside phosphotransferase family protein [Ktedonobacterales bacterium]